MILIDTSVWIDHLRQGVEALGDALEANEVLIHAFVIGELACGNLQNRREVLDLLGTLPFAVPATDRETLFYIERWKVMGRGISYIDGHLLASVALTEDAQLWTRDKRLAAVAGKLRLAAPLA